MPLNPDSPLAKLMATPVQPGSVIWIGVRPARRAPMQVLESAELVAGLGLKGDRYGRQDGERQVTLIGVESLASIASFLGEAVVTPDALRRNIVTRGINLLALKDRRFRLGEAILETTGECHPCSRLEETLGQGGYSASRGQGGITARVIEGGAVRLGDAVTPLPADPVASGGAAAAGRGGEVP